MNIVVEKQPKCIASASVEIPADTVRSERQKIVNSILAKARVPGFRPGKTPLPIIEKRFAKEISAELSECLTQKAVTKCYQDHSDLRILDISVMEELSFEPNGHARLNLECSLTPSFELPEYKDLKVSIPLTRVEESDIDAHLEELRERTASFQPIEGRPVEAGDVTRIDFTATIGGEPISKATTIGGDYLDQRENYWLKIEEDSFLPGVAMQLVGMQPGESRTVTATMPEDHPIESLRNQTIDFAIKLVEAGTMQLPLLDDDFASKFLPGKSLAELRDFLRNLKQSQLDQRIYNIKADRVLEAITASLDFELPERLLNEETQRLSDLQVEDLSRRGVSDEEIAASIGAIVSEVAQQAAKNLRTQFVLNAIAEAEQIQVTQQEILQAVARAADSKEIPVKKLLNDLVRQRRVDEVQYQLRMNKTVDFLLEQTEFEEVAAESAEEPQP